MLKSRDNIKILSFGVALTIFGIAMPLYAQAQNWSCWDHGPYHEGPPADWWPHERRGVMIYPYVPYRTYHDGRLRMGRFGEIDSNHDGAVSDEETAENTEQTFYAMDANEDEALTEEEFMAVRTAPGPTYYPPRQGRYHERKTQRFIEMDKDQDGALTKHEFMQASRQRFEASDADGDGQVTPWEFRAS